MTHTPERLRCEVCDMPTLGDNLCNRHYEEQEKMTHTPGKWTVRPYLTPDRDDDPMMVYQVIAGDLQERFDNLPVDENEEQALVEIHAENAANAALIAAAPTMYEALKLCVEALEFIPCRARNEAEEALRLAEGRA